MSSEFFPTIDYLFTEKNFLNFFASVLFFYVHKNIGMIYSLVCKYTSSKGLFVKGLLHSLPIRREGLLLGSRAKGNEVSSYWYDLERDLEICLSVSLCLCLPLFICLFLFVSLCLCFSLCF